MTRLNFKSYGITRRPAGDFSDDGTNFRGYECKGVPICYARIDDQVYLTIKADLYMYKLGIDYDARIKVINKSGLYEMCDRYNGVWVERVDLADVVKICETIVEKVKKFNETPKSEIGKCHHCQSTNVEYSDVVVEQLDSNGGRMYREVTCKECGETHREYFTIKWTGTMVGEKRYRPYEEYMS